MFDDNHTFANQPLLGVAAEAVDGDSNAATSDSCLFEPNPYAEDKWWLVAVCGTTVSGISIFENLLLFAVFLYKPLLRQSHFYYMFWVAIFDVLIAVSYVLLMSVMVIWNEYEWIALSQIWYFYVRVMFAFCYFAMTTGAYLIVAATLERYTRLQPRLSRIYDFVSLHRFKVVIGVMLLSLMFRGTTFIETLVLIKPECKGQITYYQLTRPDFTMEKWFEWLNVAVRNPVCVYVPFFVLLFCNTHIVLILKRQKLQLTTSAMVQATEEACKFTDDDDGLSRVRAQELAVSLSSATRMLVLVVFSYLLANVLNIVITMWEVIDIASLYEEARLYTLAADVVSVLTILGGALRLPIYCFGNEAIRAETGKAFCRLCCPLCFWRHTANQQRHSQERERNKAVYSARWVKMWDTGKNGDSNHNNNDTAELQQTVSLSTQVSSPASAVVVKHQRNGQQTSELMMMDVSFPAKYEYWQNDSDLNRVGETSGRITEEPSSGVAL